MKLSKEYSYPNLSLKEMEREIWRDILAYKGSNKGRVKSLIKKLYSF